MSALQQAIAREHKLREAIRRAQRRGDAPTALRLVRELEALRARGRWY